MPSPFPHRVTMLAPVLVLPPEARGLEGAVAEVLLAIVHGMLVGHPVVSLTDPDEERLLDEHDRLLALGHDQFGELLEHAFLDDRRDEVVWLELSPEPGRPLRVKLRVVTAEERTDEELNAIGDPTLSGLIGSCIGQWLASRHLPPAPPAPGPFGATELLGAASQVARFRAEALRDPQAGALPPGFGGPLEVAARRAAWKGLPRGEAHRANVRRVLALRPDDPHALRAEALYRIGEGAVPHEVMGPVVAQAPQWGPPRLAMHGAGCPEGEVLRHASVAALLMPGDPRALHAYAIALSRASRFEEAVRVAHRAATLDPSFLHARVTGLRALRDTHRSGEAFLVARGRVEELAARRGADVDDPHDATALALLHAEACFDVGRLEEAIELADGALSQAGDPTAFRRQRTELDTWRRAPDVLAASFARDGHYRADPGRVVLGFARARPRYSLDVAMLVRALITLGHEELAGLVCAHHMGTGVAPGPQARVARAQARLLDGDVAGAVEDLVIVQLRHPQSKLESASQRVLRVGASLGAAPFEDAVARWLAVGARRVARLAARDAADFVPGLEDAAPVLEALGPRAGVVFDEAWLEPLREVLDTRALVAIDAFFHQYGRASLEHADRLAADWHLLIAPSKPDEPTWLEQVFYVLAQALARYFVASTHAPNVLAGGYRQVATDALSLLERFGREWRTEWLAPLLGVLEEAATGVDPWLFDAWILRVERALALEHETGGHLVGALVETPRVRRSLRGDERVAFEHAFALELLAEGHAEQASELLERSVRAFGSGTPALRWSEAAGRGEGDALDRQWTAALAHPTHARPWLNLAKSLLSSGRSGLALEVLARALPWASAEWRARALGELRPVWEAHDPGVPFELDAARAEAFARVDADDLDGALRCLRWAQAVEPRRADTLEAIAAVLARRGESGALLSVLAELDRRSAPARALGLLSQADRAEDAARVRRYAALASPELSLDDVVRGDDAGAAARRALAAGERARALELASGGSSWELRRVALAAAELRVEGDEPAPVRRAALVAAEDVLRVSVGTTERAAALARAHALTIRESYCFPVDPPPPLGAVLPRERFEAQWRERSGGPADPDRPTVPLAVQGARAEPPAPGAEAAAPALARVPPVVPPASTPPARDEPPRPAFHATQPFPALALGAAPAGDDGSGALATPPSDAPARPPSDEPPPPFEETAAAGLDDFVTVLRALAQDDPLAALAEHGLDLVSLGDAARLWGERLAADAGLRTRFLASWRAARDDGAGEEAGRDPPRKEIP